MATELRETRRRPRKRQHRRRALILLTAAVIVICVVAGILIAGTRERAPRPADIQAKIAGLGWIDKNLLPVNAFSRPGTALKKVNAVVVHYVGNPNTTAAQNRSYFAGLADSGKTYASSNFLIGLTGEIVQCVPADEVAYCSNGRNDDTLSIECCHPDDSGRFNADTYASLVRLTAMLCAEFHLDADDVLRHYDVSGKECPKYFVDHEDAWKTFKAEVTRAADALRQESAP